MKLSSQATRMARAVSDDIGLGTIPTEWDDEPARNWGGWVAKSDKESPLSLMSSASDYCHPSDNSRIPHRNNALCAFHHSAATRFAFCWGRGSGWTVK